jgi:hypothetical protein
MRILLVILLLPFLGYSQCGNTDFETGDFTGWNARLGTCCPIALPTAGFANTRQTIMTQGIDPHTCGGLRTVYQGTYSARLGNDRVGAQAEGLSYSFVVTPQTNVIKYAYAVVFQDPGHAPGDQPRFQSRIRLANGTVIPCTDYTVTAASNLPGFQYCPPPPPDTSNVAWKDWTEVALDLSAYTGQTVSLEFETGDCKLRGHYGYAYIDAVQCGMLDTHIPYCSGDNSLTINAMGGFVSYLWENGDTTQTTTINPSLYDTVSCVVTTYSGCQITLHYILDATPIIPSFNAPNVCLGNITQFNNTTQPLPGYTLLYNWNFGDNNTSTAVSPTHTYLSVGTYNITLTASALGSSCNASIQGQVTIYPLPNITPIIHN